MVSVTVAIRVHSKSDCDAHDHKNTRCRNCTEKKIDFPAANDTNYEIASGVVTTEHAVMM